MAAKPVQQRLLARLRQGTENENNDWDAGDVWESRLFVGSLGGARDIPKLEENGITHILTVANRLKVFTKKTGERPEFIVGYHRAKICDHPADSILKVIPECMTFLDDAFANDGKVLVHCASGVSRSVSICVVYLMFRQGMGFEEALEVVRVNRPNGNPNLGFKLQLQCLDDAGGDIDAAKASYKTKVGNNNISTVVAGYRGEANEFHSEIDELEITIQANEWSTQEELDTMRVTMANIITRIDAAAQEDRFEDRVALTIRKSAKAKCERLLALLDEQTVATTEQ